MADDTDHPAAPSGLRERKKARTREALVEAALRLCSEQGFDATTTEEIAAVAEVSQRTLFRYFPSKDEVVLSVQDEVEETFRTQLDMRPADEHPYAALSQAFTDACEVLGHRPLAAQTRVARLYNESPQLLAARLRRSEIHQDRLARTIAARTGLDPDIDPRPRLVAYAFGCAVHIAFELHCRHSGAGGVDALVARVRRCLDELGPSITDAWDTTSPA